MSSLLELTRRIVLFNKRRKIIDLEDQRQAILKAEILQTTYSNERVWGGDKSTELPRVRKDFEDDIAMPLGPTYFRRAYRMQKESFYKLYHILKPEMVKHFLKGSNSRKRKRGNSVYHIDLRIRLSAAIRYFAGGDPYDIMVSHGISHSSVYTSIWGVVNCVNQCKRLEFQFPDYEEQREISRGFMKMSGALFDNVIGAIDGMLIWTVKPSKRECKQEKCGEKNFKC